MLYEFDSVFDYGMLPQTLPEYSVRRIWITYSITFLKSEKYLTAKHFQLQRIVDLILSKHDNFVYLKAGFFLTSTD